MNIVNLNIDFYKHSELLWYNKIFSLPYVTFALLKFLLPRFLLDFVASSLQIFLIKMSMEGIIYKYV